MSEKEPSGAPHDCTQPSQLESVAPGGPSPAAQPPAAAASNSPSPPRLYTLQYLIAALKKPTKENDLCD